MTTATLEKKLKRFERELKEVRENQDKLTKTLVLSHGLNEALEDISWGRVVGPFKTAKSLMRSVKLK